MKQRAPKENEFAILHDSPSLGQILITSDYDHDDEEFKITVRWWAEAVNGFASLGLAWKDDKEADFIRSFENFRSLEFAEKWANKIIDSVKA